MCVTSLTERDDCRYVNNDATGRNDDRYVTFLATARDDDRSIPRNDRTSSFQTIFGEMKMFPSNVTRTL